MYCFHCAFWRYGKTSIVTAPYQSPTQAARIPQSDFPRELKHLELQPKLQLLSIISILVLILIQWMWPFNLKYSFTNEAIEPYVSVQYKSVVVPNNQSWWKKVVYPSLFKWYGDWASNWSLPRGLAKFLSIELCSLGLSTLTRSNYPSYFMAIINRHHSTSSTRNCWIEPISA